MAEFICSKSVAKEFKRLLDENKVAYTSWPAVRSDLIYVQTEGYDRIREEELFKEALISHM